MDDTADVDAGVFLTNEVFLYRVVGPLSGGEMVDVEDCYSLDVVRVPVRHVHAQGLRVVTPGTALPGENHPI